MRGGREDGGQTLGAFPLSTQPRNLCLQGDRERGREVEKKRSKKHYTPFLLRCGNEEKKITEGSV